MPHSLARSAALAMMLMALSACNPASPPDQPVPSPAVPPTTPAAAAVEATAALQSTNPAPAPALPPAKGPVEKQRPSTIIPEAWDIKHGEIAPSCLDELGEAASKRLVERCIAVSPATRPPCNVANPCLMIKAEINRGCDFFGPNEKPAECEG